MAKRKRKKKNKKLPPLKDGTPMLTFEVKMRLGNNDTIEKAIFINGEHLDWAVDVSSLMDARRMGLKFFEVVKKDIQKHFVESVSEFVGRKVTVEEIKQATKTGWI